ncbi:MAG TPA: Glu/Leu/Phe/Val dehydrogenase dimerization domain-containing protein, partial [Thermoanaerobaculia bacterium]|nr:Glu/Leu/Phe/Val dehydrogenase dimerization domain-containing protein [Thermoanaerobaculia bacterium]
MTSALDLAAELGHERVIVIHDPATGLRAVVAIHSWALGPAVGGTRMRQYARFDDAVADALRLARAMTYKAAYAGFRMGGAKAVIDADPAAPGKRELLAAFARAIVELEGRFVTGGDMGVDQDDVELMASISSAFEHAPKPSGASDGAPGVGGPDASDLTAIGVVAGMRATAARLGTGMEGLRVAVQGVGEVGGRLAPRLAAAGARLVVADVVRERALAVAESSGAEIASPEEIVAAECDVFSPNAAGGVLTVESMERLRCRAICGAANIPLASPEIGDELHRRGILYAPDFVVSAGGILSLLYERGEVDAEGTVARVERIGDDLGELFAAAEL